MSNIAQGPADGARVKPRVLVWLKYLPDPMGDNKGDLLWSIVRSHEAAGVIPLVATSGRRSGRADREVPLGRSLVRRVAVRLADVVGRVLLRRRLGRAVSARMHARAVRRWAKRDGRIDAVFAACTSDDPGVYARAVSATLGVPYVLQEHKNLHVRVHDVNEFDPDYLAALRDAARLVTVSQPLANHLMSIGVRDDVGVVPNALSAEFFDPPDPDGEASMKVREVLVGSGDMVFGAWTRWRTGKRLDVLLDAFEIARGIAPDIRLVVAGTIDDPAHRARAQAINDRPGVTGVSFLGQASRDVIHALAHRVDAVVLSSDYETFGLPAIEAMAAGRPVIATRCGGPESLISRVELGRVVPPGSPRTLARAMIDVRANRDAFDARAIAAHARSVAHPDAVGERLAEIYSAILPAR